MKRNYRLKKTFYEHLVMDITFESLVLKRRLEFKIRSLFSCSAESISLVPVLMYKIHVVAENKQRNEFLLLWKKRRLYFTGE